MAMCIVTEDGGHASLLASNEVSDQPGGVGGNVRVEFGQFRAGCNRAVLSEVI
jgi:hypothetical protein